MVLSSSVALAGSGLADPFPSASSSSASQQLLTPKSARFAGTGGGSNGIAAARPGGHNQPSAAALGSNGQHSHQQGSQPQQPQQQPASAEELAAALNQIQTLKAEIAGVETVLGYLKGNEAATTTMGRKAHKLPSQQQLRQRADALAVSRAAAARTSLDASAHHLSPLRASQGHGIGAGGAGSGGASSGYGSPAAGGSPARARSAGDPGGAAGGGVFESLAAETRLGRTWRAPKGPQPVGRGEAVILEVSTAGVLVVWWVWWLLLLMALGAMGAEV